MTDAERIARLEAELEQCRKSFAQERSQLENALARLRHQYTSDVGALNAALDDRGAVPGSAGPRIEHRVDICPDWTYNPVLNPMSPNTTVEHPPRRYCRECSQPTESGSAVLCARCAVNRAAPITDRSKCPDCGVTRLPGDDGCSWCGPGAHR